MALVNDVATGTPNPGDELTAANPPAWLVTWWNGEIEKMASPGRLPMGTGVTFLGMDETGALASQFPDGHWELAPLWVRIHDDVDRAVGNAWMYVEGQFQGAGAAFQSGYATGNAAGQAIDNAVSDATGTMVQDLGSQVVSPVVRAIPWWFWLAAGVVSYGALVQAGILPPVREVLKLVKAK